MAKFFIVEGLEYKFLWYGRLPLESWIPLKQWVYQRDKGICQYCHNPTEYKNTHCHHVLELSQGGTNHPTNLKTLCIECHQDRHPFMKNPVCGKGLV